jgi:hypothetical protein
LKIGHLSILQSEQAPSDSEEPVEDGAPLNLKVSNSTNYLMSKKPKKEEGSKISSLSVTQQVSSPNNLKKLTN